MSERDDWGSALTRVLEYLLAAVVWAAWMMALGWGLVLLVTEGN